MPERRLRPFLKCQNCGEPIPLPCSTLEGNPILRTWWPSDKWKRKFLCLECTHVFVYTRQNVHWRRAPNPAPNPISKRRFHSDEDRPLLVCAEFRCATEKCEARLRVSAVVDDYPPQLSLSALLARANYHDVYCSKEHEARFDPGLVANVLPDPYWWRDDTD